MNNVIIQSTHLDIGSAMQAALLAARRRSGQAVILIAGDGVTDDQFAVALVEDLRELLDERAEKPKKT